MFQTCGSWVWDWNYNKIPSDFSYLMPKRAEGWAASKRSSRYDRSDYWSGELAFWIHWAGSNCRLQELMVWKAVEWISICLGQFFFRYGNELLFYLKKKNNCLVSRSNWALMEPLVVVFRIFLPVLRKSKSLILFLRKIGRNLHVCIYELFWRT